MKKLELELHKVAMERGLSRDIINMAKDTQLNMYRFYCEMFKEGEFGLKTYLYVPSENLNEEQACRIILSLMVVYMVGGDIDGERGKLITEMSQPNKKPSTRKAKPKVEDSKAPEKEVKSEESDEKPAEPKEEVKAPAKKKRATKPKTIAYDRNQTEHKKELSKILNESFSEWHKDKDLVNKAKAASEELVGVALFDAKGEVLPTFAQNVLELMGSNDSVDL